MMRDMHVIGRYTGCVAMFSADCLVVAEPVRFGVWCWRGWDGAMWRREG